MIAVTAADSDCIIVGRPQRQTLYSDRRVQFQVPTVSDVPEMLAFPKKVPVFTGALMPAHKSYNLKTVNRAAGAAIQRVQTSK